MPEQHVDLGGGWCSCGAYDRPRDTRLLWGLFGLLAVLVVFAVVAVLTA